MLKIGDVVEVKYPKGGNNVEYGVVKTKENQLYLDVNIAHLNIVEGEVQEADIIREYGSVLENKGLINLLELSVI